MSRKFKIFVVIGVLISSFTSGSAHAATKYGISCVVNGNTTISKFGTNYSASITWYDASGGVINTLGTLIGPNENWTINTPPSARKAAVRMNPSLDLVYVGCH